MHLLVPFIRAGINSSLNRYMYVMLWVVWILIIIRPLETTYSTKSTGVVQTYHTIKVIHSRDIMWIVSGREISNFYNFTFIHKCLASVSWAGSALIYVAFP